MCNFYTILNKKINLPKINFSLTIMRQGEIVLCCTVTEEIYVHRTH
jgi:hypothetical protein